MNRYNSILFTAGAMLLPLIMQAQEQRNDSTVNRVIVIENVYTPEIMDASKINTLPQVEAPVVQKKNAEYAITATPATEVPVETMRPILADVDQATSPAGYARLGYGNYNNFDVMGNYLFRLSPGEEVNLFVSGNGMNGKLDNLYDEGKWKSHYYRTRAAASYKNSFERMDFSIGGNFDWSKFNFNESLLTDFANQKFTSGGFEARVKSTDDSMPVQFEAAAEVMLYKRDFDLLIGKSNEGRYRLQGDVSAPISAMNGFSDQFVGVAAELNYLSHNKTDYEKENGKLQNNYTTIDLNPYYKLRSDAWQLRLAAHVDIAFNFGTSFRVSPDIWAQYTVSNCFSMFLQATGGRILNDYRRLEVINPYAVFTKQPYNSYEQINASIGFKGTPFNGAWVKVTAGYQDLKDDLFASTYAVVEEIPEVNGVMNSKTGPFFQNTNTHNAYIYGELGYNYKEFIKAGLNATYRKWKADKERDYALMFKPEMEFNFTLDVKPMRNLLIGLNYTHIRRTQPYDAIDRVAAVNNLCITANYYLFKGVSIYAQANNILNKEYQWFDGYSAEKINFLGGLSFRF